MPDRHALLGVFTPHQFCDGLISSGITQAAIIAYAITLRALRYHQQFFCPDPRLPRSIITMTRPEARAFFFLLQPCAQVSFCFVCPCYILARKTGNDGKRIARTARAALIKSSNFLMLHGEGQAIIF